MKRYLVFFGLLFLSGCASTNLPPVTSPDFHMEDDERRIWNRSQEEERVLNKSGYIYEDHELQNYLSDVVRKLATPEVYKVIPFKIKVIKNPYLNAFVFPDGSIYVHTGILAQMDNEAQFATVLGHEMTHAINRHMVKDFRHAQNRSAYLATLRTTLGGTPIIGGIFNTIGEVGALASVTGYSSDLETEADIEGLKRMVKAGYDPREAPKIFEHLKKELEEEDIQEPFFFGTHPKVKERMKNYQKLLAGEYSKIQGGVKNTDIFQRKTARLILDNALLDLKAGRYERARHGVEKYLALGNGDARAYFIMGEVYRQKGESGDNDRARSNYQKAISLNLKFPDSYRALGMLYYKQGDKNGARKNLRSYIALAPEASDRDYVEQYLKECN